MRSRYVKTTEKLNEHARPLPPLRHGDHVFIQNQSGRFPTKWDKSGTVVETKGNDQYVVKVAGTGRITLRNRRFLRRYQEHSLHGKDNLHKKFPNAPPSPAIPAHHDEMPHPKIEPSIPSPPLTAHVSSPGNRDQTPQFTTLTVASPPTQIPSPRSPPPPHLTPSRLNLESPPPPAPPSTDTQNRSTRTRAQTKFYDATTGTYTAPHP